MPSTVSSPPAPSNVTATLPLRVLDARDLDAAADDDALAIELVEHDGRAFRIVLGERRRRFQHGHFAAEPAEGLRHFQADRTGADDDETVGPLGERKDVSLVR